MNEQLYHLYELILLLKAEVKEQRLYLDPITLRHEYHLDVRIDPDDPPLITGPGLNLKRNFIVKLREHA